MLKFTKMIVVSTFHVLLRNVKLALLCIIILMYCKTKKLIILLHDITIEKFNVQV